MCECLCAIDLNSSLLWTRFYIELCGFGVLLFVTSEFMLLDDICIYTRILSGALSVHLDNFCIISIFIR